MNDSVDFCGANCSGSSTPTQVVKTILRNNRNRNMELPRELTEISSSSLESVFAYCVVFVVAFSANLLALKTIYRQHQSTKSRISLLFLHLTFADFLVCCVVIPTEVFWRLSVQWLGGNILCKATQFLRAFGLYLSSLVLICVSVDRFLAIIFPLNVIGFVAYYRVKKMIKVAWISAALFSAPQAVYFGVESHPHYPSFRQCVTKNFLDNSNDVKIYSIFSVVAMYFVPLLVIIFTYSAILFKLARKSGGTPGAAAGNGGNLNVRFCRGNQTTDSVATIQITNTNSYTASPETRANIRLRSSGNANSNISKAKTRTLLMTIVIVIAFVVCWTPYAVMTLWYIFDLEGAEKVNPRVQDALFLMVVANSCINPLIYGGFHYSKRGIPANSQSTIQAHHPN